MATLTLARADIGFDAKLLNATALTDWLHGHWGLLFSHPQDFATVGLEADRWRDVVGDALLSARLLPLRLQQSEQRFHSWIEQIAGEDEVLVLERRKRVTSDDLTARAAALRSVLSRTTDRFVAIIDERMQLRHIFSYTPSQTLPSVLDIAALANALRGGLSVEALHAAQTSPKVIELPLRAKSSAAWPARGEEQRLVAY